MLWEFWDPLRMNEVVCIQCGSQIPQKYWKIQICWFIGWWEVCWQCCLFDSCLALLKLLAMLISTYKIKQMPEWNSENSSTWCQRYSGHSFIALLLWQVIETSHQACKIKVCRAVSFFFLKTRTGVWALGDALGGILTCLELFTLFQTLNLGRDWVISACRVFLFWAGWIAGGWHYSSTI